VPDNQRLINPAFKIRANLPKSRESPHNLARKLLKKSSVTQKKSLAFLGSPCYLKTMENETTTTTDPEILWLSQLNEADLDAYNDFLNEVFFAEITLTEQDA